MAGISHPADQIASINIFISLDADDTEMSVEGLKSIAVVDDDGFTVSASQPTSNDHVTCVGGVDFGAFRVSDVNGVVTMPCPLGDAA